ncbi:hypothetical protein ACIQPQ_26800 [Streptomyces sp. NPDC091281]|uniref:hypothetical protein n=1 Tax=Streptomyces sp. NPDC091281 TaxID=3365985 RepID=UPI0038003F36
MTQPTTNTPAVDGPDLEPRLTPYQRTIRERLLAAPVVAAPAPWERVAVVAVGGLLGIGFASLPEDGRDLVMVVSTTGHGLLDAVTGERIARDREPDPDEETPDTAPDLTCPGLGPVAGQRVHIAGLHGGGLHSGTADGWSLDVVTPAWPHERVLLSHGGAPYAGPHGDGWWHVFHSGHSEFRAAGFSPSGRTVAVATSSDVTLWTRATAPGPTDDGEGQA